MKLSFPKTEGYIRRQDLCIQISHAYGNRSLKMRYAAEHIPSRILEAHETGEVRSPYTVGDSIFLGVFGSGMSSDMYEQKALAYESLSESVLLYLRCEDGLMRELREAMDPNEMEEALFDFVGYGI